MDTTQSEKFHFGSTKIKTQGMPIPGIDYGINLVSRKKNYDSDGNTLDEDEDDSPKSMHTHATDTYADHDQNRSKRSHHSQHSHQSHHSHNSHHSNDISLEKPDEVDAKPAWINDRNFMGNYEESINKKSSYDSDDETIPEPKQPVLTYEEIQRKKEDLLARLARLEAKGYRPIKTYNFTSDLKDIEDAYNKTYSRSNCDKAIKLQGKMLVGIVGGIETLNTRFDPFGIYLEGWSEAIYESLNDYDEIFEELYEKYQQIFDDIGPEIRLAGMIVMSGVMFHYSHSVMAKAKKSIPGFDSVMSDNPELKRAYVEAANKYNGGGGGGGGGIMGNDFMTGMMKNIPFFGQFVPDNNRSRNKPPVVQRPASYEDDLLGSLVQPQQPQQPQPQPQPQSYQQSSEPQHKRQEHQSHFSQQEQRTKPKKPQQKPRKKDITEVESLGDLSEDD